MLVEVNLISNRLLEYTPEGQPVPSLATAWTIAPDNQSVTVTLRENVKFPAARQ